MPSASDVFEALYADASVPYQGAQLPLTAPTVASIYLFRTRVREYEDAPDDSDMVRGILRMEVLSAAALEACSDLSEDESLVVIRTAGNDLIDISQAVMEMVGHGHFFDSSPEDPEDANSPSDEQDDRGPL